ncbi:hypothetical protein ACFVVB_25810 [Streptomyces californicus]
MADSRLSVSGPAGEPGAEARGPGIGYLSRAFHQQQRTKPEFTEESVP